MDPKLRNVAVYIYIYNCTLSHLLKCLIKDFCIYKRNVTMLFRKTLVLISIVDTSHYSICIDVFTVASDNLRIIKMLDNI